MCMPRADELQGVTMAQLKGGAANAEESEWKLIYIDGKPVWVRINSAGQIIEMKSLY